MNLNLYSICLEALSESARLYNVKMFKDLPKHILHTMMFYLSPKELNRYEPVFISEGCDVDQAWQSLIHKPYLSRLHKNDSVFGEPHSHNHRYCLQKSYFSALLRIYGNKEELSYSQDVLVFHVPPHQGYRNMFGNYEDILKDFDIFLELLQFAQYAHSVTINSSIIRDLALCGDVMKVLRQTTESLTIVSSNDSSYYSIHDLVTDLLNDGVLQELILYSVVLSKQNMEKLMLLISGLDVANSNDLTDSCVTKSEPQSCACSHGDSIHNENVTKETGDDLFDEALTVHDIPLILEKYGITHFNPGFRTYKPNDGRSNCNKCATPENMPKQLRSFAFQHINMKQFELLSGLFPRALKNWNLLEKLCIRVDMDTIVDFQVTHAIVKTLLTHQLTHLDIQTKISKHVLQAVITCVNTYERPMKYLRICGVDCDPSILTEMEGIVGEQDATSQLRELVLVDSTFTRPLSDFLILSFISCNSALQVVVLDNIVDVTPILIALADTPGQLKVLEVTHAYLPLNQPAMGAFCHIVHTHPLTKLCVDCITSEYDGVETKLCSAISSNSHLVELQLTDIKYFNIVQFFNKVYCTRPPPSLQFITLRGSRLMGEEIEEIASCLSRYQTVTSSMAPILTSLDLTESGYKHRYSYAFVQSLFSSTVRNVCLSLSDY